MSTYRIEVRRNHIFVPDECELCGYGFEPGNLGFTLYADNERVGTICPECSSPTVAAERARKRAKSLRKISDALEINALEIEKFPASIFPTAEELARVEEEVKTYWEQYEKETAGRVKESEVIEAGDDPNSPY